MAEYQKTGSAYYDYCRMVENSWTFERLTADERNRCWDALHFAQEQGMVKGAYTARWGILQAVYSAFLIGLGYDGPLWREKTDEPTF